MHWLSHWLGLDDGSGPVYLFWSGWFGDVGLFTVAATFLRHRNCEVHGCWRFGRHSTAAGHRVCRRHHPDDHLTVEGVLAAHQEAKST